MQGTFIKKKTPNTGAPVSIAKFLRAPILKNICERLLLLQCVFFVIGSYQQQMSNSLTKNF